MNKLLTQLSRKEETEGEALLKEQVLKEKDRNKAIVVAIVLGVISFIRFVKVSNSLIGYVILAFSLTAVVVAVYRQIQIFSLVKEYSSYAKERDWKQIKALADENELLTSNAAFFKSEMEKAQLCAEEAVMKKSDIENKCREQVATAVAEAKQLKEERTKLLGEKWDLEQLVKKLECENRHMKTEIERLKVSVNTTLSVEDNTGLKELQHNVDDVIDEISIVPVRIDTESIIVSRENTEMKIPLKRSYPISKEVLKGDFVAFDLETTGLSPVKDEIIELSAVRFRDYKAVSAFTTLINPDSSIPSAVTRITGISDKDTVTAPSIGEILTQFTEFVGQDAMVGHNIRAFDLKFLYKVGFDMDTIERSYYDTLSLARKRIDENEVKDYKLETLLEYFGITRSSAHRGLTDSVAEGLLFAKLINL